MFNNHNNSNESLKMIIMLGAIWGLAEAGLGFAVKGVCGYKATGSVMTAFAIMFMSAGYVLTRKHSSVFVMLFIAAVMKVVGAIIIHKPIMGGGVANPVYAFITEGFAVSLIFWLMKDINTKSYKKNAIYGGLSALTAVNLFPFVGTFTGNIACNTNNYPWSLLYAPIAVGMTMLLFPMAIIAGEAIKRLTIDKIFGISKDIAINFVSASAFACAIILQIILK